MPTLVLLDRSLSMRRPVNNQNTAPTRLSLAKEGISTLFTYFETVFPSEYVSLMSFSSNCQLVCPFTKDYSELREGLESISSDDRTDLSVALHFMTETITKEWGMFVPVQVILVSDGLLNITSQTSHSFPFPCQFNIVFIATGDELTTPTLTSQTEVLIKLLNINSSQIISIKGTKLSIEGSREAFMSLAKDVFFPYSGILKCGHLKCHFTLSPSPKMVHTRVPISTDSLHQFTNPYNVTEFPSEIKVCGFLDVSTISAPAVYSKHFLIDNGFTQKDGLEKLMKNLLLQESDTSVASGSESSSTEGQSSKPSFRVLLHGSLKCEAKLAVVQLSDNWYGLLSSASTLSKKSNLILTVLFPGVTIPWFGQMLYLGPKLERGGRGGDPRLSADTTSSYPVSVPHVMSYQAPSTLYWAKESGVQTDFTKLIRYSHKLPDKEASLVKELNKLRQVVLTYSLPHLIDVVCKILSSQERSSASSPQVKTILQRCIQFLSSNHNPHDRLVPLGGAPTNSNSK